MSKIIMYGDFNALMPAFISINGGKERTVSAKVPVSISVPAGKTHVFVSSVSKLERMIKTTCGTVSSGARDANAFFGSFEDAVDGDVYLEEDDCLIIWIELAGLHTNIHNKVVPFSEAGDYVENFEAMIDIDDKPKPKNDGSSGGSQSKWLVFILCLFLGIFGVHRFFERKIGTGILYLCTLGICGIGVIVDLINIARREA